MFGKSKQSTKSTETPSDQPMQFSIEDAAPCQKAVRVQVLPAAIAPVRESVLREFQKEARLDGFRKGHAPTNLVEKRFGSSIQDETLQRVTRLAFEQAAKEHELRPVGPFEVSKADYLQEQGLTLEAKVEVEPVFALGEYRGIALKRPAVTVSSEEINKALTQLQESMAQLVPSADGQTKERQVPALDDELAKDLGQESLDKLKEHVEGKLREQKQTAIKQALEAAACDALVEKHPFDLPSGLVQRQAERLTRDFKVRLLMSGLPEEQADGELSKFTDKLRTSAERQVKLSFVIDRIAEKESLQVTQDELVERLWQLSQRWNKDPLQVREILDKEGLWQSVVSSIRQDKTLALVMEAAAITDEEPRAVKEGGK